MTDVNQSLDSRRIAREQESRLAAAASMSLNAAKPFIQFQSAMLRLCSESCEMAAQNYEKSIEALSTAFDQQQQRSAQQ